MELLAPSVVHSKEAEVPGGEASEQSFLFRSPLSVLMTEFWKLGGLQRGSLALLTVFLSACALLALQREDQACSEHG